jgi:hypothetical protein
VGDGLHNRRGAVYFLSLEQYVANIFAADVTAARTADEVDMCGEAIYACNLFPIEVEAHILLPRVGPSERPAASDVPCRFAEIAEIEINASITQPAA